jgi:hypothetical protein
VNWVKQPTIPATGFVLDGIPVDGITAELRTPERSTGIVPKLPANKGRCFEGPIPSGEGFVISEDEANALLASSEANYRDVVRPYLDSDDITEEPGQRPRRWIIDFAKLPLEAAMRYPKALDIVRERVKPERDTNNRASYRKYWWLFAEPRREMRRALQGLQRYIAGTRHGKRLLVAWCQPETLASDATATFAFDDDYSMGVLTSSVHGSWAWARSSTIKGDLRYTSSSVFMTFSWPDPVTVDQRERISESVRSVIDRRQTICAEKKIGLTHLYNLVEEGAYEDLKDLHANLDEAVAEAYGWPKGVARDDDEMVRRLLDLNAEIAAGERRYDPFGVKLHVMDQLPEQNLCAPEKAAAHRSNWCRLGSPSRIAIRGHDP